MNLYEKNLLIRSHPRSLVYAAAVSLVLIGYMRTTCRPKPCPSPPPHPLFVSSPCPGTTRESGWGGGRVAAGHLLPPVLRPNSLTALTRHICQWHLSYLIGHPFIERTPLSEPQSRRCPRLHNNRDLKGGGGLPRRGEEA